MMRKKKESRRWPTLAIAAAMLALAAGAARAQSPLPDPGTKDGNSATQSVGTVQVGPATVDPTPVVGERSADGLT